jgi:hypothetical protein
MGIDVQQTFKQLDLSPINVLQTDRNMGLLSQENMFLTLLHNQVLRNDGFFYVKNIKGQFCLCNPANVVGEH